MLPAPQCHRSCHSRFRVGRDASHSVVTDPHSSPVPPDAAGGARYEPVTPSREVVHSSVIYVLADGQVHTGCVPARELPERVPRIFSLLHRCLPHSRRRAPRGVVVAANSSAIGSSSALRSIPPDGRSRRPRSAGHAPVPCSAGRSPRPGRAAATLGAWLPWTFPRRAREATLIVDPVLSPSSSTPVAGTRSGFSTPGSPAARWSAPPRCGA